MTRGSRPSSGSAAAHGRGRLLNSDALGDKGEHRFAELCADAGLFANKVGRDRTGWDFNVEFPFPAGRGGPPLDSRPQPTECRVQVKAVWANAANIKLRLSSAERLAKWRGPAFVVVLVVNERTLVFERMYGLHVRDEVLSAVLRSLRECERKDSTKVNQTFVRLNHKRLGEALDVSGLALSEYLFRSSGPDLEGYVRAKSAEAETLGVKGARFSIRMRFSTADEAEIADVMLGLKRGKVDHFVVEETKWDITLPIEGPRGVGEVSINPAPHASHLVLRGPTGEVVSEEVSVYLPAGADVRRKVAKVRISGKYFEFVLDDASARFSFSASTADGPGLSLATWLRFARAQSILISGGILELKVRGKRTLCVEMAPDTADITAEQVRFLQALLTKLRVISEAAGGRDFRATALELEAASRQIEFLYETLTSPGTVRINPIRLVPVADLPEIPGMLDCLFTGRIHFGDSHLAWCALAPVGVRHERGSALTFEVGNVSLRRVELLEGGDEEYEEFRGLVQDETSINLLVDVGQDFGRG